MELLEVERCSWRRRVETVSVFSGVLFFPDSRFSFGGAGCDLDVFVSFCFIFFFSRFYLPASGQAVVISVVPSPPRFLPSIFYRA